MKPTRLVLVGILALAGLALASSTSGATRSTNFERHAVPAGEATSAQGPVSLNGRASFVVQLSKPSVAEAVAAGTSASQAASAAKAQQSQVLGQIASLGGAEVARVHKALNAVVVRVDRAKVGQVSSLAGVQSVNIVRDYELDLSETVPYIGGAALQSSGLTGAGVDVAVLDSGIDYTYKTLGGSGTAAAYEAAYGTSVADPRNTTTDGLFPTAKVFAGYDFVGESWPTGDLAPDPDPIDCGPEVIPAPCDGGHGSHVADIIAGTGDAASGHGKGVAPGARLMAVKVCSAVSTSCSGVALLQAVDFALDPNGDGNLADRADVLNLSLGSDYGQKEDDLTEALEGAVKAGAVVVTSAGNAADKPYIVGSPSTGQSILSVAQTQTPSSKLYLIKAGSVTVGGSLQPWSAPITSLISGPLVYDTTNASTRRGCTDAAGGNPYAPGSHAGQVLLMDRGTCAVSLKVSNAAAAGAKLAIIANNVAQGPGDLPPDFSFGGGDLADTIPGLSVTLVDGNALKTVLGSTATVDPASAVPLVGNMVASSSRGPSYSYQAIKPEIGAPGASVSAEAGTGTGTTAFGGTSGSAPMVSGSAALLLQGRSNLAPIEVKSLLMNTGDTNIGINPFALPGVLAPITRIGGGEVRVDDAYASLAAAWVKNDQSAALSFGYTALSRPIRLTKTVTVRNYGITAKTYAISTNFRFANDAANGAVKLTTPSSVTVPGAKGTATFTVELRVDPSKLPSWAWSPLLGGVFGGDGFRLQANEYDGYLVLDGGAGHQIHLPWHVLPHRSADVNLSRTSVRLRAGSADVGIVNDSAVQTGGVEVFALTGQSKRIPRAEHPNPGDNFALIDLKSVGVRAVPELGVVEFGIDTFDRRSHPNYPAEFDIFISNDADADPEYVIFNAENGGFAATGQNVTFIQNLTTGATSAFFFTGTDLNSGNVIMTVPLGAVGLTPDTKFTFDVFACDNYFTGVCTDSIEGMTHTLSTPKYRLAGDLQSFDLPPGGVDTVKVQSVAGGAAASPSQTGLLFMYLDQKESDPSDFSRNEAQALEILTFG